MNKEKLAVLSAILAGSLWATVGITVRILAAYQLTSLQIVVVRCLASASVLAVYMLAKDRSLFRLEKKDIKMFLALGLLCILFYNVCFALTVQLTSLTLATGLLYTSPIWAMVTSVFLFKEKLTGKKAFSILLNFTGCALMCGLFTGFKGSISYIGILTGLLAGLGYGNYGIFIKLLNDRYHSLTINFYTFIIAGGVGLLICQPGALMHSISASPNVVGIMYIVAFVSCIGPYLFFNFALSQIEASRAALIVSFELVMATIFGVFLYREAVTLPNAIGIVCILSAIMMQNFLPPKKGENA